MSFTTSDHFPTPQRWKGLKDSTIGRPQAAPRMPGLDAFDYSLLRIPKSSNAYVIPPLRNEFSTSPTFADFQPPLKRAKFEEPKESSDGLVKRPRSTEKSIAGNASSLDLDLQPELKRGRFNEEHICDTTNNGVISSVLSHRESDMDSSVQQQSGVMQMQPADVETTASDVMAVDSTNMTFESLIFKRLKDLCKEHGIAVPKGAKKVDCVSLLSEKYPAPRTRSILENEPYSSFTKEALEEKCRELDISDTGSKAKLVERLEAFSIGI